MSTKIVTIIHQMSVLLTKISKAGLINMRNVFLPISGKYV